MNMLQGCAFTLMVSAIICPRTSEAAVVDSSASGFTLKFEAVAEVEPMKCYRGLVQSVGQWWSASHTFSGDAANLYIEDRAGGCFCERLPDSGSVQHLRVVRASPGNVLRLQGGLGPLQELAVTGSMTWQFAAEGKGTRVMLTYAVGGYRPGGLAMFAPPVNQVLAEQLGRFVRFMNTGSPEPGD